MWEYFVGLFALLRALVGIRFFLIKRRVRGPVKIAPLAEPFIKKTSGNKVALLIHGFTSSPGEFRRLSEYLLRNGISSYAPLLAGHGTSSERLSVVKYYQWIEDVEASIKMLAKDYSEIYLVGNSFGGNLALLCTNYSDKIKGIVTLGTPIVFRRHKLNRYFILPLARRIKIFQKKPKKTREFIKKHGGDYSYSSIPLRSTYEILKVLNLSKKELSNVTKPIFTMYVDKDPIVSEISHNYILKNVSSSKKYEFMVPKSQHVFILDKYASLVNRKVADFIGKN